MINRELNYVLSLDNTTGLKLGQATIDTITNTALQKSVMSQKEIDKDFNLLVD